MPEDVREDVDCEQKCRVKKETQTHFILNCLVLITFLLKCLMLIYVQGDWGLTQQDEEDQRRRQAKFLREMIPTNRAQLKVLAKSYQVGLFTVIKISHFMLCQE